MSENLNIIKRSYASGAKNDVINMLKDLTDESIWIETAGGPYGGTYTGKDTILQKIFARIKDDWEKFACIPEEFYEAKDTIIMTGWYEGINLKTKKDFRIRVAHVWHLSEGKIMKFEQFTDTALLLAAMK